MDYINSHHFWKPLAALSLNEEVRSIVTDSHLKSNKIHDSLRKTLVSAVTLPVTHISVMEDDTDVWHRIIFHPDANSIFNRLNETELNATGLFCNSSICGNYSLSNETTHSQEVVWQLVTMIGTAVVLGLLILATVIGEFHVFAL